MTFSNSRDLLQPVLDDIRRYLVWQKERGERDLLQTLQTLPASAPDAAVRLDRRGARAGGRAQPPRAAIPVVAVAEDSGPRIERTHSDTSVATAPSPVERARASAPSGLPNSIFELPPVRPVLEGERKTLDEVRREIGDCSRCKLCKGRRNIVFGVGNPKAELVFVGEGPGADEDAQGVPFVGKAGQLLTKMIEAMGFGRDDVYICNVVKCRPPDNRNPEIDEIAACEPFLRAQLGAIRPRVIVALGKFAAQTLLRDETKITQLRGKWREYCGIPLMPTYHPAYLLRNPAEKRAAWGDLLQVMNVFGKAPARGEG